VKTEEEDFEAALKIIVEDEACDQAARGNRPKTPAWFQTVTAERRSRYLPLLADAPAGLSVEDLASYLRDPDGFSTSVQAVDHQRRREITMLTCELESLEQINSSGVYDEDIERLRARITELSNSNPLEVSA